MKVILNSIDGVADAIVAMYFSKRTYTEELDADIRERCDYATTRKGSLITRNDGKTDEFLSDLERVLRIGRNHITLLRYIDLSFTVLGLHRAGQDDWDAHAWRFNNRIIRSSTRLANFKEGEKSDFYKDKILTTNEALEVLEIKTPNEIEYKGQTYVKAVNGYILKGHEDNNDVKRGLYMLSIPSNFIFRICLTEFAHFYKMRNNDGHANPEVKQGCEECMRLITEHQPSITRDLMLAIKN
jgi:hypothetical protein